MTLDSVVKTHVSEILHAMQTRLNNELNASLAAIIVKAKDRALAKKMHAVVRSPKSDEEMRCRHSENGHRCKERSRGPRFRFMCEKHCAKSSKKTKAKPEKTEPVKTEA